MFSLVNAIIIRDLPFEDPETLVNVYGDALGGTLSYPDYEDLVEGSKDVFAGVSGVQLAGFFADVEDGVETLLGEAVTGNYFSLTGIQPALGRLISTEDHIAPGTHRRRLAKLRTYSETWRKRTASDLAAIGTRSRMSSPDSRRWTWRVCSCEIGGRLHDP